jgi:hypothetical protein
MEILEKIASKGSVGIYSSILCAYYATWRTVYAVEDMVKLSKELNPKSLKEQTKYFCKIAKTVKIRDLFSSQGLDSHLHKYPNLKKEDNSLINNQNIKN